MKLVIDIPEKYMSGIRIENGSLVCEEVLDALYGGTLLPKGHGRLIDADKLMELCINSASRVIDCNDVARFPTIIEADKGG